MAMTNRDAAQDLIDEALSWPGAGPGESIWQDWVSRARGEVKANGEGKHHDVLSWLVKTEREDGLSLAHWETFLSEAGQLEAGRPAGYPGRQRRL